MNASHRLAALLGLPLVGCLELATFPGSVDASLAADATSATTTLSDAGNDSVDEDTHVALDSEAPVEVEVDVGPTPSEQLAAVRAVVDGPLALRVEAVVTYLKVALDDEPAGFFLQAELGGPALFVAVDPASLALDRGARVSLRVDAVRTVQGRHEVSAVSEVVVLARDVSVDLMVADVSTATDLTSALDTYESELVTLTATIVGPWQTRGDEQLGAAIDTAGSVADPRLVLRVPRALPGALDLTAGCVVRVTGPMWRTEDEAQPSGAFEVIGCAAPRVLEAVATSATNVRVRFDRQIAVAPATAITIAGLDVVGALADGVDVDVTTAPQVASEDYTVLVGPAVSDKLGEGVAAPYDSATFTGYRAPAKLQLRELNPHVVLSVHSTQCDMVEVGVVQGGDLTGFVVRGDGRELYTFGAPRLALVETGAIIVIHTNPAGIACRGVDGDGQPVPGAFHEVAAPDEVMSSTFYPGAFDVWAPGVSGSISPNSVALVIHDADGKIIDAAAFHRAGQPVLSNSLAPIEAARAVGEWTDPGAPYTQESYITHAVGGIDLANNLPTSPSLRRVAPVDTNSAADWEVGPQTFGE